MTCISQAKRDALAQMRNANINFGALLTAEITFYGGRRFVYKTDEKPTCSFSFKELVFLAKQGVFNGEDPQANYYRIIANQLTELDIAGNKKLAKANCFARYIGIYVARLFSYLFCCHTKAYINPTKEIAALHAITKRLEAAAKDAATEQAPTTSAATPSTAPEERRTRRPSRPATPAGAAGAAGLPKLTPTAHLTPSAEDDGDVRKRMRGMRGIAATVNLKDQYLLELADNPNSDPQEISELLIQRAEPAGGTHDWSAVLNLLWNKPRFKELIKDNQHFDFLRIAIHSLKAMKDGGDRNSATENQLEVIETDGELIDNLAAYLIAQPTTAAAAAQ